MLLTRDEILDNLEQEYGIKITVRSFDYYRQKGLIPPIQSRKNRMGLYPEFTPELIKKIKDFQKGGEKLSEIKEFCEMFIHSKKIMREADELLDQKKYRDSWYNSEIRGIRILSFLKKENKDYQYDSFCTSEVYERGVVYFALFCPDFIEFYKLLIGLYQTDSIELIEKKRLNINEYMAIVRALIGPITANNRVINQEDIFLAIFA